MAPPSAQVDIAGSPAAGPGQESPVTKTATNLFPKPLKYSGSLDSFENFDVTAVIGREFPKLQLSQIIEDDVKIRDLAITGETPVNVSDNNFLTDNRIIVSQRGVVFFRKQDITNGGLKVLAQKLGEFSGKPKDSGVSCRQIASKVFQSLI
jgi:hypothetical protein